MTNDWEEMEYRSNKLVKIIWYTWQKLSVNVWHFNSAKSLRFCRHIGATGQKRRKAIHVRYFFANKLQYTYSVIAQSSTKTTIHEEVLYISILFSVHSIEIVWFLPSNLGGIDVCDTETNTVYLFFQLFMISVNQSFFKNLSLVDKIWFNGIEARIFMITFTETIDTLLLGHS